MCWNASHPVTCSFSEIQSKSQQVCAVAFTNNMADEKEQPVVEEPDHIYILSIMVKSGANLPDLDFGAKDHTDPVVTVSFKDPTTGCSFVWRTTEIYDELNPVWNESHSWPLLFNPPDDLMITFDVLDVDSFTKSDKVGKLILKLSDIGMLHVD